MVPSSHSKEDKPAQRLMRNDVGQGGREQTSPTKQARLPCANFPTLNIFPFNLASQIQSRKFPAELVKKYILLGSTLWILTQSGVRRALQESEFEASTPWGVAFLQGTTEERLVHMTQILPSSWAPLLPQQNLSHNPRCHRPPSEPVSPGAHSLYVNLLNFNAQLLLKCGLHF